MEPMHSTRKNTQTQRKPLLCIGADHRGFPLKQRLLHHLTKEGYHVKDLGARRFQKKDNYPIFGFAVARTVARNPGSLGILLCGSGIGISIAANRVHGVRAGLAMKAAQATAGRRDDAMNILVLASDFTPYTVAVRIIHAFLQTKPSTASRYTRRIRMLG